MLAWEAMTVHFTSFSPRRGVVIALVAGLTLAATGLWVVQTCAWEPDLASGPEGALSAQTLSAPGAIAGTVLYSGMVTGTHMVWVGTFASLQGGPPLYSVTRSGPGAYTLTDVAPGVYHVMGGMDVDDSGGAPNPPTDLIGFFARNPVTVTSGATISSVDVVLLDAAPPPPTGTSSIRGRVSYSGRVTAAHNIVVFASRVGQEGPPAHSAVLPVAGPYTMTEVAGGAYTVAAYMDLGDDMGPPGPDEPFGWHAPSGDGTPDPVNVSVGNPAVGIDIVLRDRLRYVYLPVLLKVSSP